jgi:hypothetical protein
MVQCETRHESIDPKRRKNARYYEGDTSGLNQEHFQAPKACTTFPIWDRAVFTLSPLSRSLLPSQRYSNFQPDSANGVPKERHTAYIHGPPNSTSSGGGLRCQNCPKQAGIRGVLWRITYFFFFWISVSRFRAFMISTNSYKSLLSILLHIYSYNSQSPYLVTPAKGNGAVGLAGPMDSLAWMVA